MRHGVVRDAKDWLFLLATTAACLESWSTPAPGRQYVPRYRHPGCTPDTLSDLAAECGLSYPEREIDAMVQRLAEYKATNGRMRFMSNAKAGKLAGIGRAEREELKIKTLDAIDEPKAKRQERKAEEKREHKRLKEEARRRAMGCQPRQEYEGTSLSRTRPWEADGVSRRTLERRRARAAAAEAAAPAQTHHPAVTPRHFTAT